MEQYEHGGDIYGNPQVRLDFSVNTNPLGMPPGARAALIAHIDKFMRYPDPQCRALRAAIALHEGVPEDWVICGNGAADLIYRLCFAMKPKKALVCAPTFSEYERAMKQVGCQVSQHFLKEENLFLLTEEILDMLQPGLDMLFLCHPNNPTGRLIPEELLRHIIKRAQQERITVVVDECFLEFSGGASSKAYLDEAPCLIVLKAFTKTYAMAGLRLGYILASGKEMLGKVKLASQVWSVSVPAQIAGEAALEDEGWMQRTRCLIAEERGYLAKGLSQCGAKVYPGDANFLLFQHGKPLYEPLLQKGIMIRPCGNFEGLDASYHRVCIKTREENIELIKAIKEIIDD